MSDQMFDGRATDRTSYAYKLGRCIGALEIIIQECDHAARPVLHDRRDWRSRCARIETVARGALSAIGREVRS